MISDLQMGVQNLKYFLFKVSRILNKEIVYHFFWMIYWIPSKSKWFILSI